MKSFGTGGYFSDPDLLEKVMDALLQKTDVSIAFTNGLQGKPILQVEVDYKADTKVSDEVKSFEKFYGGDIRVCNFNAATDGKAIVLDGSITNVDMRKTNITLTVDSDEWTSGSWGPPIGDKAKITRMPSGDGYTIKVENSGIISCVFEGQIDKEGVISGEFKPTGVDEVGTFTLRPVGPAVTLARDMGVTETWALDIDATLARINTGAEPRLTKEALMADPDTLLPLSDVTLVFRPCGSNAFCERSGGKDCGYRSSDETWRSLYIKANEVRCQFSVKGYDLGEERSKWRWGIFAVAIPAEESQPTQEAVDELVEKVIAATARARGMGNSSVVVEYEDWDEQRLRALCAKHSWDFEWMDDEGERKRRIGQRPALARKEQTKASEKARLASALLQDLPDGHRLYGLAKHAPAQAKNLFFKYKPLARGARRT